jgi:hypothetical protein
VTSECGVLRARYSTAFIRGKKSRCCGSDPHESPRSQSVELPRPTLSCLQPQSRLDAGSRRGAPHTSETCGMKWRRCGDGNLANLFCNAPKNPPILAFRTVIGALCCGAKSRWGDDVNIQGLEPHSGLGALPVGATVFFEYRESLLSNFPVCEHGLWSHKAVRAGVSVLLLTPRQITRRD